MVNPVAVIPPVDIDRAVVVFHVVVAMSAFIADSDVHAIGHDVPCKAKLLHQCRRRQFLRKVDGGRAKVKDVKTGVGP
ncbi:hypothetical protein D3C86_1808900 [compost metagenome]